MKGKFSILSFSSIAGPRDKEEGDWVYENGVISRGIIFKQSLNLAYEVKEVHELPGTMRTLVIDAASSGSFYTGASIAGGNVLAGMLCAYAKENKLDTSMVFTMVMKIGKHFNVSTQLSIFNELIELSGVPFITTEQLSNRND